MIRLIAAPGRTSLDDFANDPATGSPVIIDRAADARDLRLAFPQDVNGADIALFEWIIQ